MKQATAHPAMRFGPFEVDPRAGELRKHGIRIKLRDQSLQILLVLLERPGEVVTREELRARLWPADTFVDFDHGLNAAVNKLRQALADSAEEPRYIETLPRRGYRLLVAPESPAEAPAGLAAVQAPTPAAGQVALPSPQRRWYRGWPALAGLFLVALVMILVFALRNTGVRARLSRNATNTRIESIVVLPLENLSKEAEQEYFVEGMTDQLTTNLAKIAALRVISRTSATRYKGTHKSLADIARELNVDAVVEGTVLRSGERVRITAQLIQAATDRHLWAESYEGDLGDILVLQDKVAQDIAEQIRAKLTPRDLEQLGRSRHISPEAYEAYLKGRYFWSRRTPEALQKAVEYFQQAVDKDPSYALAYSGLADSHNMLGDYSYVAPGEAFPRALALAAKALELDDTLAEAHSSLAFAKLFYDRDWAGAEHHFKRAIELNPNYAPAHQWYAINTYCP
jgi:TolB-like protein/DNA-binding winged helix-turn-helix (wHTH) protein